MSVQICEGIWRNRCGQRLYITERKPVHGQRWTDGLRIYSDDGTWVLDGHETAEDLVEFVRPLPDSSQPDQSAEIDRLKAEWQSEFTAAQQLRSEVAQLERLLDDARDNLRVLEADGTAMDHHCEGMKAAYLAVIKTLTGGRA